MSFSGGSELSRQYLQVDGVPMGEELIGIFLTGALSPRGNMRDRALYSRITKRNVLSVGRYNWLVESLEERIKVFRLLTRFLLNGCPARNVVTGNFVENVTLLRPTVSLERYLAFNSELLTNYPSKSRGGIIHQYLTQDYERFKYLFPNTSFLEMSQLMRGTSWVPVENWGRQ